MTKRGKDIGWCLSGKQHLIPTFIALMVQPQMRAIAFVIGALRFHKARPTGWHHLRRPNRAIVPQKFAKLHPVTRRCMDHASPQHCAVAVKFRDRTGHAKRFKQTATGIFQHRITAHSGIFAVGQGSGHDVGKNVTGGRAIFKFFSGNGLQWPGLGVARNIFPAIQKQHARCICIKNLDAAFRHFGMV